MKTFKHRVAVVTGAASGIGKALAMEASNRGMKLVISDNRASPLLDLRDQLQSSGTPVLAVPCDVRDHHQMKRLAQDCMRGFGSVHLLFNNAGVGQGGLLWEHHPDDLAWMMGVNVTGVFNAIQCFTPLMLDLSKHEHDYEAHVVNTSSLAGMVNGPLMGIYNASKHAVTALSETLYQDLKLIDSNIGVSVLCPSFVPTQIARAEPGRGKNAPQPLDPTVSQKLAALMHRRSVAQGPMTADAVAQFTFEAIAAERFYIFPHDISALDIGEHMSGMLAGHNPVPATERHPCELLPVKQRLTGDHTRVLRPPAQPPLQPLDKGSVSS